MTITQGSQTSAPDAVPFIRAETLAPESDRVSLAPLGPEQALRALLATPPKDH